MSIGPSMDNRGTQSLANRLVIELTKRLRPEIQKEIGKMFAGILTPEGTGISGESVDISTIAHNNLSGLATGDPHVQYQKESEKNAASGYAGLSASTKIALAQIQEVLGLTDLSNVVITTPSTGQVLRYNGTSWVNDTGLTMVIQELDGTPTGTPGTLKFPNGSITDNLDGSFTYTPPAGTAITIAELDGTPSGTPGTLKFPNGSITDNLDGSFTYTPPAGTQDSFTDRRPFDPASMSHTVDEFWSGGSLTTGNVGDLAWLFSTGSVGTPASQAGHPGILQRLNALSNNSSCTMSLGSSILPSLMFDTTWILSLVDPAMTGTYRFGIGTINYSEGCYFERLSTDTNWFAVARAATVETRTDTGIAANDSTWHRFRVRRKDASTIGYSIDGGTEIDITTNIPTAVQLINLMLVNVAAGAVNQRVNLDYFDLLVTSLSR